MSNVALKICAGLLLGLCACVAACHGDTPDKVPPLESSGAARSAGVAAPKVDCGRADAPHSIRVCGNLLVDSNGDPVQLRGVNVGGPDGVAIQGWSPSNPWGGVTGTPTPDWNTIKTWGVNAVRLTLNEASWLGLTCVDKGGAGKTVSNGVQAQNRPGMTVKADPGGNYQATVKTSVAEATAAGLFVIIDLHLTAPGDACPTAQNRWPMPTIRLPTGHPWPQPSRAIPVSSSNFSTSRFSTRRRSWVGDLGGVAQRRWHAKRLPGAREPQHYRRALEECGHATDARRRASAGAHNVVLTFPRWLFRRPWAGGCNTIRPIA